ncbi:GGDEF domain-containing protein [Rhodobacteraceae bacterium RKSG542]|uniref:diguanylate cyclase domain-containing protein n=1 Tax=Pseudovibrio flavus TaxID=2529854 RepID=UPI0012BC7AE0|nr:diguanylate cyclase [Pseudovibrio flavus]MTI16130.1 GGDEF domain-containing protein [Pseudovibrio flavus]
MFSKRPYTQAKLCLVLGIATFVLVLIFAGALFKRHNTLQLDGYQQMLQTLETTFIQQRILQSERQQDVILEGIDKEAIKRGEPAINERWAIAYQIRLEKDSFVFFYNHITKAVETYPKWVQPATYQPTNRPWYKILEHDDVEQMWFGPYEEFISGQSVVTLARKVCDDNGNLLGLILVDMSLTSTQAALERTLGSLEGSLFIRNSETGQIINIVNPELFEEGSAQLKPEPSMLKKLTHGTTLIQPVGSVDWEVGLYVPPSVFQYTLVHELFSLLGPLFVISIISILGVYSLLKVFKQEQLILQERLTNIGNSPRLDDTGSQWFIKKSLKQLQSVEESYLTHREAVRLDPLTGLQNRRAFDEDLPKVAETEKSYALVLVDIDHFKQINDGFGHQHGDRVIVRVAQALKDIFGSDRAYRLGGDEFAGLVVLEGANLENLLDHLLKRVKPMRWGNDNSLVTLSIGAAMATGHCENLFATADSALYQSKLAGRNRWSFAKCIPTKPVSANPFERIKGSDPVSIIELAPSSDNLDKAS